MTTTVNDACAKTSGPQRLFATVDDVKGALEAAKFQLRAVAQHTFPVVQGPTPLPLDVQP
jgi:hypothetical protein